MGTLVCRDQGEFSLHKELLALELCIIHLQAVHQIGEPDSFAIRNQLERVSISIEVSKMAQPGENAGIMDIKKNLRRMYELIAISVMDNKEMAREVKSMSETVSYTSL